MEKRGAGVVAAVSNFCGLTTFPEGPSYGNASFRVHKLLTLGHQAPSPARYLL